MERGCGITLITLFLTIVEVYGQACPGGSNVVQMCVSGSYSGGSVLIDTASYNPNISNCSCTFGTTSSIIKLVTYVAPNYPECNSAVRLYSSSGNSIRFQCLMSGTYLDTSVHNAGVATFEKYGDMYDKNYCLMLEIAGRIGDIVTVTCTGNEATAQNNIVTNVSKDILDTINDTMNTANNTNYSTTDNPTYTTTSLPLAELSTIDPTAAKTETLVETSYIETMSNSTSINKTENQVDLSNMDISTKGIIAHTRKENFRETSKTEMLTTAIPLEVTTLNSSDGQNFESNVTDVAQLKQEMAFINSGFDDLNATSNASDIVIIGKTYNITNDILESLEGAGTYRKDETKPTDTVTAIVTGTVLFNGGGKNSSKTIQTIGAVPSDSLPVESLETSVETTTSKVEYNVSSSNLNTKPSQEPSEFLLSDMPGITQPTDVSNLLVMESNPPKRKSGITGAERNITDSRSSDYSLQFPSFEPSSSLTMQNDTSNMTDVNFSDNLITAYTGLNESLRMKTNLEASIFMNSRKSNVTDTIQENNTVFMEPLEADRLSIKMASPDSQIISTEDVISHNTIIVGAENKSHFTTKEVRFVTENTEPTDVVGKITIRSVLPSENTTNGKITIRSSLPTENTTNGKITIRSILPLENTTNGKITIRSILPTENTTDKMKRDISVSSMEGNHGASSTKSISTEGMEIRSFITESPGITNTTLGTESKAMEISSFVTESADFSQTTLTTNLKGTDSFSTNLIKENTFTLFEQTTPVQVSNENFTNAQSMFKSTGKSDISNTTKSSESNEEIIVNPTVGNELSSNYTQSMFESTGKSDLLNTTKFSESTEEIIVNPTIGNEKIFFNPTPVNKISSNYIPTTPSSLDLVYKESSVSTESSNTAVHSEATSPVPTTTVLNTSKAALFEEHGSFGAPSYHVPEQNSTDSTVSAFINESLNLTETTYEVIPGHNKTIDDVSRIHNRNVSFSDASLTEVLSPSMNETNINFLSSIQRINSPNLNLNESIRQQKTQSLYDSEVMPNDNITVSELNNTQVIPDTTIRNLPLEKQESAILSQDITSEATSTAGERNINNLTFLHNDRVFLSDVNISENSTNIKDHLSFVHHENAPRSSSNETEVTQEITTINRDNRSFVQRTTLPFTDINTNEGLKETTRQSIDRMFFVKRERLPSEDIESTGPWQDITTPFTDQMAFVHRDRVQLTDRESTGIWQEIATKRTDQMSFVQRENLPSVDIKSTGGWQDITTPFTDQIAFVPPESVPLTEIKSTEGKRETTTQNTDKMSSVQRENLPFVDIKSTGGWQDITTPFTEQIAFVPRESVPLTEIKSTEGIQETTTQNIDKMPFVQRENLPSVDIKSTGGWQDITTPFTEQMAFVPRESVPLTEIKSTEGMQETTIQNIDKIPSVQRENLPSVDIKSTGGWQDITTPYTDQVAFIHRDGVPLTDIKSTEGIQETTTQNIDQMSFVHRKNLPSADIKSTGRLQEITTPYKDQTAFVHRDSVPLTDIKPTGGWQEITTKSIDQMSFVQRDTFPSTNIKASGGWQEITTQSIDQMSDVYREHVLFADNKASEISPETTTQNINKVSFFHRESIKLADINSTAPETAIKNSENASDFVENEQVSDTNVVEVPTTEGVKHTSFNTWRSTSIPDSKASQNINETGFGTSFTEQPKVTRNTSYEDVFDSGIDQHNLLVSNETHLKDTYHDTAEALPDIFSETTKNMPASTMSTKLDTFADQVSSKDSMNSTTGLSPTSATSFRDPLLNDLTSNIPEISTKAPIKVITTITEEIIVHEKINKEEVVAHETILQEKTTSKPFTSVSTESYAHSDILAGIENQIITETKSKQTPIGIKSTIMSNSIELNTPLTTEVMVKDIEHSVKITGTKSPDLTTTPTTDKSNTMIRNEDLHPENIHPEPISPRLPSSIDNHMNIPTTPAHSFHTIEETVEVSAEINPIKDGAKTDPVGENGLNVYFDTGSSKNSPFEMNNDTYIIVVGAIVGLVVLAVVIGILCHNSRKTRSEKVNISGEIDPNSHQNQAFDSEAADAEQGASSNGVVRDSSVPVENNGSNDTSEKEHNGNVES